MMTRDSGIRRGVAVSVALAVLWGLPAVCPAHEVDQFTVPKDKELADLGDYFNEYFISRIEEGVTRLNRRIDKAVKQGNKTYHSTDTWLAPNPTKTLQDCHLPDGVARCVRGAFPGAMDLIEGTDRGIRARQVKEQHPGKLTAYKAGDFDTIYQGLYFPLDPRQFFRLWKASNIKVYGTYMGTDKFGHLIDMGYIYYKDYRKELRKSGDEAKGVAKALRLINDGLLGENGALGYGTAGSYSNADLAANYVGMLFSRNLTQPTRIKGRVRPPILVRNGEYWKLSSHVRLDPRFFAMFISDHFDEVLNPSLWESGMRKHIRKQVAKRCASLMDWYADENGHHRSKAYFDNLVKELSTYYGESYGHSGEFENLIHLGNTRCGD